MTCRAAGRGAVTRRHPGGDLCGVRDRKLPYRWAKADGSISNDEAIVRLQTARQIWQLLSDTDDYCVARASFIGVNPRLGTCSLGFPVKTPERSLAGYCYVWMTSVGSGSILVIGLMLLYPGLKASPLGPSYSARDCRRHFPGCRATSTRACVACLWAETPRRRQRRDRCHPAQRTDLGTSFEVTNA